MPTKNGSSKHTLVIIYLLMVLANWIYVDWVQSEANIVEATYFVLMPLFGYFYFTFAFISAYFIYNNTRLGFSIGCCVLTFGMIIDVVSYSVINIAGVMYEAIVIALVIMNAAIIFMLAASQSSSKES